MDIRTHEWIDQGLCGKPVSVDNGTSRVELTPTENMRVDQTGLIHGGFIFGLADYAAMIAVNHPNVVLGGADVKFLKPVKKGMKTIAEAKIVSSQGKKRMVDVTVQTGEQTVFKGSFACFVLEKHVLDP
jgi:uncharacterized protein (TIGR00369 family)